jgi:hypothetical protein
LPIQHIHTYLVHPGKGSANAPAIGGTSVAVSGKLFRLLENIYSKSDSECDIDISFNSAADGSQNNPCRTLFTTYVAGPTLIRGRRIAERLFSMTDRRSGLGLLFLIVGKEGNDHKFVISRFPTDSAILAEENQTNLTVEFLERVFMKSATSYKAAVYQHASLQSGFWLGSAVDKQINSRTSELSDYWILDFLDSDFRITPAAGTRRFGAAMRNAARNCNDLAVKSEIAAAVTLAGALAGRRVSINDVADQFGLSTEARTAIIAELKNPASANEQFQFDMSEFSSQVAYRSVELDNGGVLTAESAEFEKVFDRQVLDKKNTGGSLLN